MPRDWTQEIALIVEGDRNKRMFTRIYRPDDSPHVCIGTPKGAVALTIEPDGGDYRVRLALQGWGPMDDPRNVQRETLDVFNGPISTTEAPTLAITGPERDAILAALQLWQHHVNGAPVVPEDLNDIATNGGEHEGLDVAAIDALCERINV